MARYTGPLCRICRRAGEKLFLKGERCLSPKCAVERRRTPPGEHASTRRRRTSDWALQLREKQKARYIYGVLERQFRKYFDVALTRPGVTGQYLMQLLERRLDNVVFRLSITDSRGQARELVRHGHFTMNGHRMNIPSYQVNPGDVIAWKEASTKKEVFKESQERIGRNTPPPWLTLDSAKMVGQVIRLPESQDIEGTLDTRLIVEFYSR